MADKICMIDPGHVSFPLVAFFSEKHPVTGFCINQSRVDGLNVGRGFFVRDIFYSQANISKAQRLLSYQQTKKLRKGLSEATGWYDESLLR